MLDLEQAKDRTPEERRVAICIFDDVAEQCRDAAIKYGTFKPLWSPALSFLE